MYYQVIPSAVEGKYEKYPMSRNRNVLGIWDPW